MSTIATDIPQSGLPSGATFRWIFRYAGRRWASLLAVLVMMLVKIGLDVLKPWPMKVLVDYALSDKPRPAFVEKILAWLPGSSDAYTLVTWCVGATVIVFLAGWLVEFISASINLVFGQRLAYDLAGDLFGHLQRLSLRFHARRSVGDSLRRVTSDSTCISTVVKDAILPAITSVVTLVVMFAILWRLNPLLSLIAVAAVPLIGLILWRYATPMVNVSIRQQEVDAEIYNTVERTLSAIPVVQAFTREDETDREFRQRTEQTLEASLSASRIHLQFKVLVGVVMALGTLAITWIGGGQAIHGTVTLGDLLVFLSYLAAVYSPLEVLAYTSSTVQGAAGSARRVLEVLHTPQEVRDAPAALHVAAVRGRIELEGVEFGYDPGRPVLRDVSVVIDPGQTVAIVGPTGAGKSTLVGLIPRFFDPWQGRVLVDGRDLRQLKLKELRGQISLVLQEPFLFPLTIAQNIAYGKPSASVEQIESAARAANAHEFIEKLPEGYQTIIGERGATLSGGQRQRLSIARALLKDAPILILDEPTSALDAGTESLLLEALARLMKGRTTLIIAHRLSTIRNADTILVLEDGSIVAKGNHQQLIHQSGLYSRLHAIQFGNVPGDSQVDSHMPGDHTDE